MATRSNGNVKTFIAGTDIVQLGQFHFVALDSPDGDLINLAPEGSTSSAIFVGVLLNKPIRDSAASVQTSGVAPLRLASAVTSGDPLSTAVGGLGKTRSPGEAVLAYALESGVTDQVISCLLISGDQVA